MFEIVDDSGNPCTESAESGWVASQFKMMRNRAGVNLGWRGMVVGEGEVLRILDDCRRYTKTKIAFCKIMCL